MFWNLRRSQNLAVGGHGDLARLALGQTEIHDVWFAVGVDQNVRRFQVAVDHTRLMRVLECLGYLGAQLDRLAGDQRLSGQPVGEIQAIDQVADNLDLAVFAADLVDADDVGVPQLRGGPRLADKLLGFKRTQLLLAGDLDRHAAVELDVLSFPDGSESAGTQFTLQLEVADCGMLIRAVGQRLIGQQVKPAVTRGTGNVGQRRVVEDFQWVLAMCAADLH